MKVWYDDPRLGLTDEPPMTPAELREAAIRQTYSIEAALHDEREELVEVNARACDDWLASYERAAYDEEVA